MDGFKCRGKALAKGWALGSVQKQGKTRRSLGGMRSMTLTYDLQSSQRLEECCPSSNTWRLLQQPWELTQPAPLWQLINVSKQCQMALGR